MGGVCPFRTQFRANRWGWRPSAGVARTGADTGPSPPDPHGRAKAGWCAGRYRLPADASPMHTEPGAGYSLDIALSTLNSSRYLNEPKTRFPVGRLFPFSGAGISPAESAGLNLAHRRFVIGPCGRQRRCWTGARSRAKRSLRICMILRCSLECRCILRGMGG